MWSLMTQPAQSAYWPHCLVVRQTQLSHDITVLSYYRVEISQLNYIKMGLDLYRNTLRTFFTYQNTLLLDDGLAETILSKRKIEK